MRRNGLRPLISIGVTLLALAWPLTAMRAETKRIFALPPTQWDNDMSRDRPALRQGPSDLAALTGGIVFGLSPNEVNTKLPLPTPGIGWATLPSATEYPDDVRYFWVRLDAAGDLRDGMNGCASVTSYVVFLFRQRGLFRISWRLPEDAACPSTRAAAEDLYGRYLSVDRTVSLAIHYRAGKADVVEITDPSADYLLPYRWSNRQRRR